MTAESHILADILRLSVGDVRIWRNNVGAYKLPDGRFIRYGLANPGGSDLIGFCRVTITPDMVGRVVPLFTAIEVKSERGRATPEQLAFIAAVQRAGGLAGLARSVDDARSILSGAGMNGASLAPESDK